MEINSAVPGFSSRSSARNSAIVSPTPFDLDDMRRSLQESELRQTTDSNYLNVSGTPTSPFMTQSAQQSPSLNQQFPTQQPNHTQQQTLGLGMQMAANSPYSPLLTGFGGFNPQQAQQQNLSNVLSSSNQHLIGGGMSSPNLGSGYMPMITPMSPNFAIGSMSPMLGSPSPQCRTVYVGNIPPGTNVDEILDLVKYGPLENIRVLPEKNCIFLSFFDVQTASSFLNEAQIRRLTIDGTQLRVGWGKHTPIPTNVQMAILHNGACRNVYLGNLDEGITEEYLREDLSRFGPIDQVKILKDKNVGFVHFLSIAVAMKVVATLPSESAWSNARVNYGKDRCVFNRANTTYGMNPAGGVQSPRTAQFSGNSPISPSFLSPTFSPNMDGFSSPVFGNPMSPMLAAMAGQGIDQELTRTVYIGNLSEDTRVDELCNAVRGGLLQSVKFMQDKHIAFVTFIELASALFFVQYASTQGVTIKNRRLKIGWGKASGQLPRDIAQAVQEGATRNIYVGQIEDPVAFSEDRMREDFSIYGEIELINSLREKKCVWVNFCNISSAIKALEAMKANAEYENAGLKLAYGKDRCANAPKVTSQNFKQNPGTIEPSTATRSTFGNSPQFNVQEPSMLAPVPNQ